MPEEHYRMPEQSAPVLEEVDVVVAGGGFPGVCAAIAASRAGAKVAIVERDGMLGARPRRSTLLAWTGSWTTRARSS